HPGLVDGATQVTAAHAELEGDQTLSLLAVNGRVAGVIEPATGVWRIVRPYRADQVSQPDARSAADRVGRVGQAAGYRGRRQGMPTGVGREARTLCQDHLVVDDVHRDVQDRRLAGPPPL